MNAQNFQDDENGNNWNSLITLNLKHVLFSTLDCLCLYLLKRYIGKHMLKDMFIENALNNEIYVADSDLIQKICNVPDKLCNIINKSKYKHVILRHIRLALEHGYFTSSSLSSS